MNVFDDAVAVEWLSRHWVFMALVTVGDRVKWSFVTREDGFPWGDYYVG